MAKQTINYGTPPAGADGDTVPVAMTKMESNFTEVYGRIVGKGYISGLQMKWVSATALTLTSGAAYIQGTDSVLFSDSDIAKTGLSLTASTWYHAYAYNNAGTPDFVLSTTAPATAYNGAARSMTGDSNKRYVGSVKTDASGNIYNFQQSNERISYNATTAADPFLVLSSGRAIASTDVACTGLVPITAKVASLTILNSDGAQIVYFTNTATGAVSTANFISFVPATGSAAVDFPVGTNQSLKYIYPATPTGACFIRVSGYIFER